MSKRRLNNRPFMFPEIKQGLPWEKWRNIPPRFLLIISDRGHIVNIAASTCFLAARSETFFVVVPLIRSYKPPSRIIASPPHL